jgi:hypothetical protein
MGNIIRNPQKWIQQAQNYKKIPKCAKRSSTRLGRVAAHPILNFQQEDK